MDTLHSTSAYLVYLGSNLISWFSKKQPTIACSSADFEYCSLSRSNAETTCLSYLLYELGISLQFLVLLYCDNLSATNMATNPVFHARIPHIELDYYNFVCEKVLLGSFVFTSFSFLMMCSSSLSTSCAIGSYFSNLSTSDRPVCDLQGFFFRVGGRYQRDCLTQNFLVIVII